ncbi:MAG: YjbH domain-containing protein, partial [Tabrizicola sp.]|nr:YjbH domain-containing protein [Tabrizicola sp.]
TANMRFGIYSLYGSEVGLVFHVILDPKSRMAGGVMGAAPVPVKSRPARTDDPEAYDGGWVTQADAGPILRKNLAKRLAADGIGVEDIAYTATTVQVRIRNGRIDAGAQAVGRTARALSQVMPASVEVFEIVPVVNGIGASKVTIRRSDLEGLEYTADNASLLRDRVTVTDAGPVPAYAIGDEGLYPKFTWSLRPALRLSEPLKGDIGLRLSATYDIAPGFVLSGSIYKQIASNTDLGTPSTSPLPRVRTDESRYTEFGDPTLERLTFAWYGRPAPDVYSRLTLGYLERMQAGVSGELLWKPVDSQLALGAELNYTRQRDTDGGLGFDEYDYDVVTGYVSAYYDFGNGYLGQLDVGRYLAGDVGATISVDRVFANGWRVGAFATVTDVSAADFGETGFDKGIRFTIPFNWALGTETRKGFGLTLRPGTGDGGARVEVAGRLYESIREYHTDGLDPDWGRVWR